ALIGSVEDIRSRKVPNRLTYFAVIAALTTRTFMLGWPGLREGLIGAFAGGGVFFFLYLLGGMGAGDVKLMGAVSAWAGGAQIVNLLTASAFAGGAMGIVLMFYRRRALATVLNSFELIRHHLTAGIHPHPQLNVRESSSLRVPFAPA